MYLYKWMLAKESFEPRVCPFCYFTENGRYMGLLFIGK